MVITDDDLSAYPDLVSMANIRSVLEIAPTDDVFNNMKLALCYFRRFLNNCGMISQSIHNWESYVNQEGCELVHDQFKRAFNLPDTFTKLMMAMDDVRVRQVVDADLRRQFGLPGNDDIVIELQPVIDSDATLHEAYDLYQTDAYGELLQEMALAEIIKDILREETGMPDLASSPDEHLNDFVKRLNLPHPFQERDYKIKAMQKVFPAMSAFITPENLKNYVEMFNAIVPSRTDDLIEPVRDRVTLSDKFSTLLRERPYSRVYRDLFVDAEAMLRTTRPELFQGVLDLTDLQQIRPEFFVVAISRGVDIGGGVRQAINTPHPVHLTLANDEYVLVSLTAGGGASAGHWVCYALCDSAWYILDDYPTPKQTRVASVTTEYISTKSNVLLYIRRDLLNL